MTPANIIQHLDYHPEQAKECFELIYNQYAPVIYGLTINAMFGDDAKAQGLTVQIFKTIFYQLHQYNSNKCRLFTWIYIIAKNELKAAGIELLQPGNNRINTFSTYSDIPQFI